MFGMFANAESFNQPLNSWDVSNVTNMSVMFGRTTAFDQPLDNWDTSNVTNMALMFGDAESFNQPLNNFNTSNVTNMLSMFGGATSFNQPISNWDTSNVTSMELMFKNAITFNQSLNNFSFDSLNVGNILNEFMIGKTDLDYDAVYYDEILINLDNSTSNVGGLGMGTIKYTVAGSAARASLVTKGWVITDGGQV